MKIRIRRALPEKSAGRPTFRATRRLSGQPLRGFHLLPVPAVSKHDVLLASTGDGTLGKACVFDRNVFAVADGHVTVIRVDPAVALPSYVADYLRCGFGHDQIQRLFTGSTGLIELTPEHVRQIVVELPDMYEQSRMSADLREEETRCDLAVGKASLSLAEARQRFHR